MQEKQRFMKMKADKEAFEEAIKSRRAADFAALQVRIIHPSLCDVMQAFLLKRCQQEASQGSSVSIFGKTDVRAVTRVISQSGGTWFVHILSRRRDCEAAQFVLVHGICTRQLPVGPACL